MKNWLRRRLRDYLYPPDEPVRASNLIGSVVNDDFGSLKNLNLNIYYATGGVVIKSHRYDHKTDRSNNSLYIIREDQDLATELSRIVTVESLK